MRTCNSSSTRCARAFMPLLATEFPSLPILGFHALTPDRSPSLGLVRVLERAIKEAKADLRPSDWE